MGRPGLFLIYFCLFIIVMYSGIQTQSIRVEGKDTDHYTTTTAL